MMNLQPHLEYQHLLYVYPESVNLSKYSGKSSARNISLEVRVLLSDANVAEHGPLPAGETLLFGRSSSPRLVNSLVTGVQYHQTKPHFDDEIKIALPALPIAGLHLLFIFKHIQCRPPGKKDKDPTEAILGYSWLPLTTATGFLPGQDHEIPVAYNIAPHYLQPHVAQTLRYVDKARPLFAVRTNLISTIYSEDSAIQFFFDSFNAKETADAELRRAVEGLPAASPSSLYRFFPVVLSQLLQLVSTSSDIVAKSCFDAMGRILQAVEGQIPASSQASDPTRYPLFEAFVTHFFVQPPPGMTKRPFHEVFCATWLHFLTYSLPSGTTSEPLSSLPWITYTWFFFGIVFKSLVCELADTQGVLSREFFLILSSLLDKIRSIIAPLVLVQDAVGNRLNTAVSFFMKDLLSIGNHAPVFGLIARYLEQMDAGAIGNMCTQIKFDLISILFSHQWLVPLSMPPIEPDLQEYYASTFKVTSPSLEGENSLLASPWGVRHVLPSLLVHHCFRTLNATKSAPQQPARARALRCFHEIMCRHMADLRFANTASCNNQERIAMMYAPFILLLIDNEASSEGRLVSNAIENWNAEDSRTLFTIVLWILKVSPLSFWRNWWQRETESRRLYFFTVLANLLEAFEYESEDEEKKSILLEGRKDSTQDQVMKMASFIDPISVALNRQNTRNAYETISRSWLRRRQHSLSVGATVTGLAMSDPSPVVPQKQLVSQHRGAEVALLILDLIRAFVEDFLPSLKEKGNQMLGRLVIASVLLLLKKNHPTPVLSAVFSTIHILLLHFEDPFFVHENTPHCGDVVYELIRHCNFRSVTTRSEAATLLCAFFLANERKVGNVTKMKLACSVAIAKLVLQGVEQDTTFLRQSMALVAENIQRFAGPRKEKMVADVQELLNRRLISALHHHQLLLEHQHDAELVHDLIYQISLGFIDSPDIRFTWIDGLAKKLASQNHLEEAAQCKIHLAALISAYLKLLKPSEAVLLPPDCLKRAAPNSHLELQTSDTVTAGDGMCATNHFTREGLFTELAEAVQYLNTHQLYEPAIEVQRMVAAIHKKSRSFGKLAGVLGDLANLCDQIIESNATNARLFSNFYLVGFYGEAFKGLDGRQFIYKESGAVRLGDIMTRLPAQWAKKFGSDKVKYIPFSAKFNRESLDPAILHIQIASVEPFLEDLSSRLTPFELKNNVSRFIIENPLCREGGNMENPLDTGKLKTIFTTTHAFPFVVKRIPVESSVAIRLSPIEAAIELLQGRITALKVEIEATRPNSKTLQIVLQGSVATTVNAGPLAIIKAFLGNPDSQPADKIQLLKQTVVDLLQICQKALETNAAIIEPAQKPFHAMLVDGFLTLRKEAISFLSPGSVEATPERSDSAPILSPT